MPILILKFLKDLKQEIIRINNTDYLNKVINIGTDEDTNLEVLAVASNNSKFYCALGIHPLFEGRVESILKLYEYSNHQDRVVAIGETGLDDSLGNQVDLKTQINKFIESIELANFLHLPIIIHGNNTNELILNILKKHPPHYGFVFHCFQPNLSVLEKIIRQDGFISVGKPITKPTAKRSLEVIKNVPLDNLLIETDAPYMSSEPNIDGKAIFNKIKSIRGMKHKELETALDTNAKSLFKKLN